MTTKPTTRQNDSEARITPPVLRRWKAQGRKIVALTAYDYTMGRLLDQAGVDFLLVGDSLGMAVQGHSTTLRVTLDQMIYHTEMVARAAQRALVVTDLPFGSYQVSPRQAVRSASRILKETDCQAVKVEGGKRMAKTIRALVDAEIPVVGHVGLTPQSVRHMGGFQVQRDVDSLQVDAQAVADAGAFAMVVECVPAEVAGELTRSLPISTIGIGAGAECDGQILVTHDLLGLLNEFQPRFVRQYADFARLCQSAVEQYRVDVTQGTFPSLDESFRATTNSKAATDR